MLHGRDVLYVVEERAPGRPPLVTDVGVRLPAHLTASGRAILAALPAARCGRSTPTAARSSTGTARARDAQRPAHRAVRDPAAGLRVEDGEVTPGLASVAAAVLDHNGHPVAGIAVTYPEDDAAPARRAGTR